jgi:hypothetical protein
MEEYMTDILSKKVVVSAICGITVVGWAQEPIPVSLDRNNLRLTYETVQLPNDEDMGLVGLSYQMKLGEYGYGGLGVYGAATGERGGFFAGGFEGGLCYPLSEHIEAEAGLFVGGGGGGAAPQGGGLMLRPHVGISYGTDFMRAGVQLSRVEFPNGEIGSSQISGLIDIPFESFRLKGGYLGSLETLPHEVSELFGRSLKPIKGKLSIELQHYSPMSGSLKTDGSPLQDDFSTIGIYYSNALSRDMSWHISSAGAMNGDVDGYAEIFTGLGWQHEIATVGISRWYVDAKGSVGMAGGGLVDTGGGAMGKVSVGISCDIGSHYSANIQGGYIRSLDGNFESQMLGISLSRSFVSLRPSLDTAQVFDGDIEQTKLRIHPIHETYISAQRKEADDQVVSLVGMQIDILSDENWYLYGKAMGAYNGEAGGYATGTIGGGAEYNIGSIWSLYAQGGIGAAGGGGIDVGSGAIAEVEGGVRLHITPNTTISAGAGMIHSFSGELESPTLTVGVGYKFGGI